MSDSALVLVASVESPAATASRVLAHLAEAGIIEPLPTDSALGALAHRPGARVLDAVEKLGPKYADFRALRTNGLEVSLSGSRRLFVDGDEMPILRCPSCSAAMDGERALELAHAPVNPFKPVPKAACKACKAKHEIREWKVENGAFGNLALRFWNWWPLTQKFIARVGTVAECSLTKVHEHI
jgi:hypothetical protein